MSKLPKRTLGHRTANAITGMIVGTPLVLLFLYRDVFSSWPWVQFTFILTIITALGAAAITPWQNNRESYRGAALGYAVGIFPLLWLMLYPGANGLGLSADTKAHIALPMCALIHGAAYYLISSDVAVTLTERWKSTQRRQDE